MFKKIALSIFVIAVYVIYSVHQRTQTNDTLQQLTANTNKKVISSPAASSSSASTPTPANGQYKDGSYTGKAADAFYGYIQVKAVISGGKITDVIFLQYPNDRRNSVMINDYAMPLLKQQAIQAQSAHVDGVSGASDSSQAFVQSLSNALTQAE